MFYRGIFINNTGGQTQTLINMEVNNLSLKLNASKELSSVNGSALADSDDLERIIYYLQLFTHIFLGLQIVVGLTGNIISLIVWTKGKECSKIACSLYFKELATSDILALISSCWYTLISDNTHFPVNTSICITQMFFLCYALQLSTWLVVCIAVERVLSLAFPFSFSPSGAKTRAKVAFVVLIIFITGINSYTFFIEAIYDDSLNETICRFREEYMFFIRTLFEISTLWALSVVPFSLIMTCNVLILIQLCLRKRTAGIRKQNKQRVATFTRLSIASGVLMAVSLFPLLLYNLCVLYQLFAVTTETLLYLKFSTDNVIYLNNSLNCLVYCFSSRHFRSDLRCLFQGNTTELNTNLRNCRKVQTSL